ncbi:discoidin domain-containing protein [Maridesulfovibrio hydrothermalis]|uniref:NAD glycohydrolase translocation F5/8 type C domain-containing protein n=1 Tax=Maridesulfovibrio hydrothermalis AM13 = DSM 14728 TaxID=1121451 RepID=L0RAN8_9BACT|nr:discoidin domain-containing protein [Maridesulfovibrio hydrothermalis]CCO23819.1 conserved exported protein of unknown function [Maridesulfovibrio hydrothermalis AM13 = DSM 14728]
MFKKLALSIFVLLLLPAVCIAGKVAIRTSSFIAQSGEAIFNGNVLSDGDYSTGWIENGDGDGPGQWLQFFFPTEVIVDSVIIRNGIGVGNEFKNVNRIKDIFISYSKGQRQSFTLLDSEKKQSPAVKKWPTTSLVFSIRSVYSDGKSEDAGLSEIVIKYHKPTSEELDLADKANSVNLVAAQKSPATSRKKSSEEQKALYKNMSAAEKKEFVVNELKIFFDRFYTSFVTINEEYPRMYTEEHFLRESAMFENFRAMLKKRGVLGNYKKAIVSTADLKYDIRTLTPTEVELWVKGEYTVMFDMKAKQITEKALYHLKREHGEWKVDNKVEY